MYAVIAFLESNCVDWVPMKWVTSASGDILEMSDISLLVDNHIAVKVYWPPTSNPAIVSRARNRNCNRETSWSPFECRILGTASTGKEARDKAALAEDTSNIESVEPVKPVKRKRCLPARIVSSESSADDEDDEVVRGAKRNCLEAVTCALPLPPPPQPTTFCDDIVETLPTVAQSEGFIDSNVGSLPAPPQPQGSVDGPVVSRPAPLQPDGCRNARVVSLPHPPEPRSACASPVVTVPVLATPPCPDTPGYVLLPFQRCIVLGTTLNSSTQSVVADVQSRANASCGITTPTLPTAVVSGNRVLSKVLTCLEELKQNQQMHSTILQHIMAKLQMPDEVAPELPADVTFPLNSIENVESLDEKLMDGQTKTRLTAVLTHIGGSDLDDLVKRILSYLFTAALARRYNVTGQKGKQSFSRLKLFQAVVEAAAANATTRNSSQKDVEIALRKFFTGSRDRGADSRKRTKSQESDVSADI